MRHHKTTDRQEGDRRPREWVIVGAGPCGLAALDQLLANGVAPPDITIVTPDSDGAQTGTSTERVAEATILSSYESARRDGALAKRIEGQPRSLEGMAWQGSQSRHWGASCLPLTRSAPGGSDTSFLAAYERTVRAWHVSAEVDGLTQVFPLTGERTGSLRRKDLAHSVLNTAPTGTVGHSRLAVRGNDAGEFSCSGRSVCFHGCPTRAPWRSDDALTEILRSAPGLRTLPEVVKEIRPGDASTTELCTDRGIWRAYRVIVAAGWQATSTLLGGRPARLGLSADLQQSTVVMAPLLLRSPAPVADFHRSFTYHDLVVPHLDHQGGLAALTQVYLPTHELAGRMLASAPAVARPAVRQLLSHSPSSKGLGRAMRHLGVAMTFFPGTRNWASNTRELAAWRQVVPGDLRRALTGVGGRVINAGKVVLGAGQSQHVGAWAPYRELVPRLLEGDGQLVPRYPAGVRAVAVDPCILPSIQPGPQTATAAAWGRVLIDALIRDWA